VPEILAVVELATHDLAEMVDRYLPGGHLLTIRDWQRAKKAADWYQRANNLFWVISAVFSPVTTGTRYAASRVGLSTPLKMLQQNLILWFYTAFLQAPGDLPHRAVQRPAARRGAALARAGAGRETSEARPRSRRRRAARGRPHRDADPDGPGQGGQVQPDQRASGRAKGTKPMCCR